MHQIIVSDAPEGCHKNQMLNTLLKVTAETRAVRAKVYSLELPHQGDTLRYIFMTCHKETWLELGANGPEWQHAFAQFLEVEFLRGTKDKQLLVVFPRDTGDSSSYFVNCGETEENGVTLLTYTISPAR